MSGGIRVGRSPTVHVGEAIIQVRFVWLAACAAVVLDHAKRRLLGEQNDCLNVRDGGAELRSYRGSASSIIGRDRLSYCLPRLVARSPRNQNDLGGTKRQLVYRPISYVTTHR